MASRLLRLQSFGVAYDVRLEARGVDELESRIRAALPPGTRRRRGGNPSRRYDVRVERRDRLLVVDDDPAVRCASARELQDLFEGDVALFVAAMAPKYIFVHAGVVAWKGRALLLPGRTMSGKSTLVQALVRRGATYHSDEYAVVDEDGLVHPYPRRMSLRRPTGPPRRFLPGVVGRRGLRPGWVIGSRYEADREDLDIEPLSPGRTALLLLDNTVPAQLAPARALLAVRRISEVAAGATLVRGDVSRAAKQLLLLLPTQGIFDGVS